jgi:hypothetical protein
MKAAASNSLDKINEFGSIWKTFIRGGLTSQFLTDMIRLFASKKPENQLISEGLGLIFSDKEIADPASKIVLGYLTAIKGVHFKSQASATIQGMLSASSFVNIHLNNPLSGAQKVV